MALLAISGALGGPVDNSSRQLDKRQDSGTICVTYHVWNPAPDAAHPTACGQTMADIKASSSPYVSMPAALFDAYANGQWPNPLCKRQVEITNVDTGKTVIAQVMDCESLALISCDLFLLNTDAWIADNGLSSTQTQCKDKNGALYGPVSIDVEQAVYEGDLGATLAAGKGVVRYRIL